MNYKNTTSTIDITNTNCSRKRHQCIQGATTTHKIMNKPTRNKHPLFKISNLCDTYLMLYVQS